jgi:phage tail-like protein
MGAGVTYGFTTSLGEILTRVPVATWYLDFVKKQAPTPPLLVANRFPPPPITAYVEAQTAEPYPLTNGESITVSLPTYGALENGSDGTWNITNGQTLLVQIDGGYTQTITLTGLTDGAATPAQVAASIHDQIRKARAEVTGVRVTITTKEIGTTGSVQIVGGTAATGMSWSATKQSGAAGDEVVTFSAVAGAVTSASSAPYALSDGMTLTIAVDGGGIQTVTFTYDQFADIANATAVEVADAISGSLAGGLGTTQDVGAKAVVQSETHGTASTVQVTGGTANAVLNFPTTVQSGSGDFAKVEAATAVEVRDHLTANLTNAVAVLAAEGLRVRLAAVYRDKMLCSGEAAYSLALATKAQVVTSISEPYSNLRVGQELKLQVDAGPIQTIKMKSSPISDVQNASAEYLVDLLNASLVGATAYAVDDATKVAIRSDTETNASSVEVLGGSANLGLDFPVAEAEGAGVGLTVTAESESDEPIEFHLFNSAAVAWDWVKVWVTTNFGTTLVWDSTSGTAAGWFVVQSQEASPGSGVDDVWTVALTHTTDFVSDERVTVRVQAEDAAFTQIDETWYFDVEDTKRPFVSKIVVNKPRQLRLQYNEPMDQGSDYDSAIFFDDVSGRVSYYKTLNVGGTDYNNVIEAPTANFGVTVPGMFLGSWGAQNAVNNGSFKVLQRLASDKVQVDGLLVDEAPVDPKEHETPTLVLSSYRIVRTDPGNAIRPTAQPIVLTAQQVSATVVPRGDESARYVDLELVDDLTPSVDYDLEVVRVSDLAGNEIGSVYPLASWQIRAVPDRQWDLWELIPHYNKDKDVSRDLERTIRSLDEAAQVLLNDVDQFGDLMDPLATKDNVVDVLLESLGNPLQFVGGLDLDKKRDLIPILVPMYKLKGISKGIEDAVKFFVGKIVVVVPWDLPADTWTLGVSLLGYNTFVGPSKSYVRYSFRLQHTESLTDEDKSRIEEIVDFIRPAHTHFVGYLQV